MLVAAIAIAVIMHDVVSCMSLHALYNQISLSQGNPITMMSLLVHFFRLKLASSCLILSHTFSCGRAYIHTLSMYSYMLGCRVVTHLVYLLPASAASID